MNTSQSSIATSSGTTNLGQKQQSLTNVGAGNGSSATDVNNESKRLFITHVDSLGPYLKISGLLNPDAMGVVRSQIQKLLTNCYTIDSSWSVARQQALLLPGTMCLYKRVNGAAPADFEFVRSRILKFIAPSLNTAPTTTPKVDIEVIDYGHTATVASFELLFPQNPEQLTNIPAMCSQYIVLGICEDWKTSQLGEILRMVAHHSLEISIIKEFNQFKFITMKWKEFNIAEFLIHQKKMGAPIANDLLFENFSKTLKQQQQQEQQQQQQQQQAVVNNNNIVIPNINKNLTNNNNNNIFYNKNHDKPQAVSSSSVSLPPLLAINVNQNNNVVAMAQAAAKATSAVSVAPHHQQSTGAINNQLREQMAARRSLSARLQQLQHPQLHQQHMHIRPNVGHMASAGQNGGHHMIITAPVQPRMPQTIGNLRSMMQGIHLQNNRIPYTGLHYQTHQQSNYHNYHQPPPPLPTAGGISTGTYNGLPGVIPASVPQFNTFNPRYQRPLPQLSAINMSPEHQTALSPPLRTTPATFKSNTLIVGQVYDVSVSFVENGPFLFSVQLVTQQDALTDMMNQIEKVHLTQFSEKPMLGTACIARYSEDGQLYRALITGVQPTACKVAYIDYGNAELVHFRDLYEIPDEFLKYKAFAIRFTLSGHKELEPIDDSLKKAFKDLVIYKNCKLKVTPLEGPPLVQYCELYLQDKNILHVLKQIQKTRLVYAKAEVLRNNDVVEIRYIDSPKNFYVQKVDNIPAFEKLMDDMFLYYNKNQNVPNHLALGAPCIVKYDNEWYRAEVMRADSTAIIVRHVDFGYEQKVTKNLLSTIAEKHLKLPRQAVQCCLKGFENNELSKDLATTQFEMLAEQSNRQRRSFTVKVFRIQPDGVNLVNLCTKDLNVMKKLYKLSMPFEQYLTLEKEDFNLHALNYHGQNGHSKSNMENGNKTPSIASSTDNASMQSSKKGHILNSTTLQSDEQRLLQKQQNQLQQQQHQSQPRQYRNNNINNQQSYPNSVTTTSEWDKQSSNSSMTENRDSRSSSSEIKQQQQQQQGNQNRRHNYYKNYPSSRQQQQQQQQMKQQQYIPSSNTSVSSDKKSTTSNYSNQRPTSDNNSNTPPRFQKQLQQERSNYPESPRKQKQQHQQQNQRPQNAPQGFSQQPKQKDNNTSKSSNESETSSKKLQEQTIKNNSNNSSITSSHSQQQQPQQQKDKDKSCTYTFVPLNKAFPVKPLETPCREEVIISWWISPHQFYTQLKSRSTEFERLMKDIQQFYRKLPLQQLQLKVGSYVMARQRKDNIIYRARIMACNQMLRKYKVHFVDFGNQYTVTSEDIWQVEKRFADFPIMAYLCGFDGIVSNYDHLFIIDRMDKYLPQGVALQCDYIEKNNHDLYYVNVNVNRVSLKQTLCDEGLITIVCPELRLDLLAGQQIRAKISSINNMLNFKIQLPFNGCDNIKQIEILCSYDDIRFVKSNQDIARKFKQFYDGKSFVLNIKDVNDNKVIFLRPLMPLLKEDIPWYICTPPILLESFNVRIVYVPTPYRLYGQVVATEMEMAQLLDDMFNYYENEGTLLETFDLEQVCAAKGSDGNWYRARIQNNQNADGPLEVYFIDYGNTEEVDRNLLKKLEEQFYINKSAYALEINLPIKTISADLQQKQKGKKSAVNNSSTLTTNESDIAVIKHLSNITLDQEITVKCLEVKNNHLIADLVMPDGKNMIDILKEQKLIKSRDVEFMRKLLDKEKSNVLEYIECVDLTLEDEDEGDDKLKSGNRSKHASPKKKKTNSKETEIEKKTASVTDSSQEDKNKLSVKQVTQLVEPPQELESQAIKIEPMIEEEVKETIKSTSDSKLSSKIEENKVELPMHTPLTTPEPVINPYADMEHAVLAHCDNPAQFFIHPMDKVKDLQRLQENLQIVASSLPPLMRIINGAYCISMYSVDKQWYRAKILDAELMVLQFIDFGNTDCVTDTTDLKEMSVFPEVEPLCIPCALPILPNGTIDWQDAANAIFNDSYNKVLDYEFITQGEQFKKSYVNLYIEGVNVMEKLIKDGYAKPLEIVDSGENCYTSHINGISDFYIQYEKDSKGLELIEIYLADFEKLKKVEKFEKYKIVAALFPDDEMWYRAKLLKQVGEGYEVQFIDYGNTSISPECREISQEIAELPPLSKKCALEVPANCICWSDNAEQKFMEIADTGETIFSVVLREPSQHYAIVHLLIDGHNINDDLEELCDKKPLPEICGDMNISFHNTTLRTSVYECGTLYDAIISHVNSPCDFYIQFTKDSIRLEDMTQSLNSLAMEKLENPSELQLCAALYPDDSKLYRARILEILENNQYLVLFVDYGNKAVTTELKTLPQDLAEVKEFSRRCQLENSVKFSQFGSIATEYFNNLIDQCEGLVKIDFISEGVDSQPSIVKAFAINTEENLCESLNKVLGLDHKTQTVTLPTQSITLEEDLKKAAKTCVISHAISPSHFYIQLKSNSSKMEMVKKALLNTNVRKNLQELKEAEVGRVCTAYSSEDDCYYRGRVEGVLSEDKSFEVFLLDYGNTITTTEIRELSEELRSIPAIALKCQLNDIPSGINDSKLEERFSALLETHFGEIFEIEQNDLDKATRVHTVKLQVNYKDLAEELKKAVESDIAVEEVFSPLPTLYDCSIIHVNSPTSFYVQLTKNVSQLEHITDVLLDAETEFPEFKDLREGAICAAQFPEDGAFYRAEIVAVLEDKKCEVHYIDFGNNSVTDKLLKLPENLLKLERCSKHCSLDSSCPHTPEMLQQFSQFVDTRFVETFQLEFLKTSETLNIVRLFYQEKNIIQEILQIIKNGDIDGSSIMNGAFNIEQNDSASSSSGNMKEDAAEIGINDKQ